MKGGESRRRFTCLFSSVSLKIFYGAVFLLLVANGLFLYSLLERIRGSRHGVSHEAIPSRHDVKAEHLIIRMEVLNGAGIGGIARRMTDYLRGEGFDVINYGNAENFSFYETVVLDRVGNRLAAESVARTVNSENVLEQKNSFLAVDVTLILGRDFRKLTPFQQERR